MAGDAERLQSVAREERILFHRIAEAHRDTRNPRVAGDLMRALDHLTRVRLEVEAALEDLTTTEPTTAGRE